MNPSPKNPVWFRKLSPSGQRAFSIALSVTVGFAVAVALHYVLYRIGLPSKPFIYVAF